MKSVFAYLITSLILLACYPLQAQQPSFENLPALAGTKYHFVDYESLNQVYHIYIKLPDEYDATKKYPTVYLLDGGATFPLLAGYYRYLKFAEEVPELIIVGISYGTDDWQKGNMRSRDFTAVSTEREYWGGADNFINFFNDELFPLIENKYSSDHNKRILFGQSLGGQFVLYAAQSSPEMFWGFIASNPALHRNLDLFLELYPEKKNNFKVSHLFVSSASEDEKEFREPALKWINHWNKKSELPWKLKIENLKGHSHFSAVTESFRQGLKWIFSNK